MESFEHVQNFLPDRTDINGHHRTRNGFTRLETDIKRIRTDTNGLKEFLSVTHPLARCDRNFNAASSSINTFVLIEYHTEDACAHTSVLQFVFFMFFFIMYSFLLLNLSPLDFNPKLKPLLPYKILKSVREWVYLILFAIL